MRFFLFFVKNKKSIVLRYGVKHEKIFRFTVFMPPIFVFAFHGGKNELYNAYKRIVIRHDCGCYFIVFASHVGNNFNIYNAFKRIFNDPHY